ncbi:MAG: putative sulfate/molybdate transporter [Solirubrobacterales bacterium]
MKADDQIVNQDAATRPHWNRFNLSEWAGAFGDLGVFIPFVVGYITVVHMDPLGVLFGFGIMMIACGLYYRTPVPVEPMKAIGAAAITHTSAVTAGAVWGAGLFTGLFWLIAGMTGLLDFVARITSKPLVKGIVLGLGFSFMLQGGKMMAGDFLVAAVVLLVTFLMLSRKLPAMFFLLLIGLVVALIRDPGLAAQVSQLHFEFRLPSFSLGNMTWQELLKGTVILAIPQIPLTLGNAVIAVTSENNRRFPDRPVTEKKMAISQGLINLLAPLTGGVPMCHGAGGLAAHARFGARTGGALVIMGAILLVLALGFSSSVLLLFQMIPFSILGIMLFVAGLELAVSARGITEKDDLYIMLVTAGFGLVNMGAGFLAGLLMQWLVRRRLISL